jgi:hypothetical protein
MWLARFQGPDGRVRQAGRFARKRDAAQAIFEASRAAEAEAGGEPSPVTVLEFFETWPTRFPASSTHDGLERGADLVVRAAVPAAKR